MRNRTGTGKLSASGGNGFAGGGGGRVAINVFSRHDDTDFFVHGMCWTLSSPFYVIIIPSGAVSVFFTGGRSFGCTGNSGAAGTYYDAVPRSLIVSNNNMPTSTDTLLLEFPKQPLWTNVYIQNHAKASVPLFWSRVQVIAS